MSRRIRSLENIRTPDPCDALWESMRGNDRVRFCEHCALDVHDLSAMTRKDALRLVRRTEGRLCVRYTTLSGGHVQTLPPPGGLYQIGRRAARLAAGAFGAALTIASSAAAAHTPAPRGSSPLAAPYASARDAALAPDPQSSGATLSGTITDPAGAAVAGAQLRLKNDWTNETREAATDSEGHYHIGGLPAGTYTLAAISAGFGEAKRTGIALSEGSEQSADLTFETIVVVETMGVVAISTPEEPIVKAAYEDDLKEVKRLLADGANARVRDAGTGTTALDEAVARGNLRMVRALLDAGADARARNKQGFAPLMYLDDEGSAEIVRALVERGADTNALDDEGDAPLAHVARTADNPAVLRALVAAGAVLDAVNEDGKTALMLAAENGNVENVRALVAAGADVFLKDEDGKTALFYALDNDHEDVAEVLRARGAVE